MDVPDSPNTGLPAPQHVSPYVPVWEKANLTVEEAAAYFNIGTKKIREITNNDGCKFVLWIGNKRLIKRKQFEDYLKSAYSL